MALPEIRTRRVPEDTFGARLAVIRQSMGGWSATEAALACGNLGDQNWRNWEAGKHPRDYLRICTRIAETTGFDLDWIMSGGPLERQKFSLSMVTDLQGISGEGHTTERARGHLVPVRN